MLEHRRLRAQRQQGGRDQRDHEDAAQAHLGQGQHGQQRADQVGDRGFHAGIIRPRPPAVHARPLRRKSRRAEQRPPPVQSTNRPRVRRVSGARGLHMLAPPMPRRHTERTNQDERRFSSHGPDDATCGPVAAVGPLPGPGLGRARSRGTRVRAGLQAAGGIGQCRISALSVARPHQPGTPDRCECRPDADGGQGPSGSASR